MNRKEKEARPPKKRKKRGGDGMSAKGRLLLGPGGDLYTSTSRFIHLGKKRAIPPREGGISLAL